jgi:hypothetical protein
MHEDAFNVSLHTPPDQLGVTSRRARKKTKPELG